MEQTMRWFGPDDPVSLWDIRQAGCTGVVTALHHIPAGEVWEPDEIRIRKRLVEAAGLTWTVVESLPVSEDIKKGMGGYQQHIANYRKSLCNLAALGIRVVTYNFMPLLNWTRTCTTYELPDRSRALCFEKAAFIAFDLFLLQRPGAENDYTTDEKTKAKRRYAAMPEKEKESLFHHTLFGLPGSEEKFTREQMLAALGEYKNIDAARLKKNLFYFLRQVIPVAEESGLQMAIHPDDPPFSILGLPRVVCTEQDARDLLEAAPSPANGLCFCTGSYGARPDNDLPGMIKRLGNHIHFLHLRSTKSDGEDGFYEAGHLSGDVDMYEVVKEVVNLMRRRKVALPMRPDHGHQMLDDLKKDVYPGYSAIGRLRGLAELRGLEVGIQRSLDDELLPKPETFSKKGVLG